MITQRFLINTSNQFQFMCVYVCSFWLVLTASATRQITTIATAVETESIYLFIYPFAHDGRCYGLVYSFAAVLLLMVLRIFWFICYYFLLESAFFLFCASVPGSLWHSFSERACVCVCVGLLWQPGSFCVDARLQFVWPRNCCPKTCI